LKNRVGTISRDETLGFNLATTSFKPGIVIGSKEFRNLVAIGVSAGSEVKGSIDCLNSPRNVMLCYAQSSLCFMFDQVWE